MDASHRVSSQISQRRRTAQIAYGLPAPEILPGPAGAALRPVFHPTSRKPRFAPNNFRRYRRKSSLGDDDAAIAVRILAFPNCRSPIRTVPGRGVLESASFLP